MCFFTELLERLQQLVLAYFKRFYVYAVCTYVYSSINTSYKLYKWYIHFPVLRYSVSVWSFGVASVKL